jgi:type I restriction enzyme, S subunit
MATRMTGQTESKVPEIRLIGFSGVWEARPIGEILTETKRQIVLKDNLRYELVTVKRRNGGVVSRGYLWGREILVKNYSQLKTGDFLISKRQVVHGAAGIVPVELNNAIVSNEYLVAVGNNEIATEFLTILASLPDMRKKFFLSSYGVDIEKLFFDVEDWKKRSITIPKPLEQTQIVGYFQELDSLIWLHQRKHDKLVALKKSMLQKMFPQAGATTPEIRFKRFSEDWEQKKLGEVGDTQSGIGFSDAEQGGGTGVPFFKVSDMNRAGNELEMFISNNYVSEEQLKRKRWTPISNVPAVIFAKVGAALMLNRKRLIRNPFLIDNNLMAYHFDANWDTDFGRALFETINLPIYAQVGALPSCNGSDIESITVQLPGKAEQQKIGTYFRQFDELISKHAIQLRKLKQIKTACLEKMFV